MCAPALRQTVDRAEAVVCAAQRAVQRVHGARRVVRTEGRLRAVPRSGFELASHPRHDGFHFNGAGRNVDRARTVHGIPRRARTADF